MGTNSLSPSNMHNGINNLPRFPVTCRRWIPSERLHLGANGRHVVFDNIKSGAWISNSKDSFILCPRNLLRLETPQTTCPKEKNPAYMCFSTNTAMTAETL